MKNNINKIERITRNIAANVNLAAEIFAESFNLSATPGIDHIMTTATWFSPTSTGKVSFSGKTALVMVVSSADEWNGQYFPLDFYRVAGTDTVIAVSDNWYEEEAFTGTDGKTYGANDQGEVYAA